jgi:hypothetical protein
MIKNRRARKKRTAGLSEMCIQARPQILSLLSMEIPAVFNHIAETKKKMMKKLRTYVTTFIQIQIIAKRDGHQVMEFTPFLSNFSFLVTRL